MGWFSNLGKGRQRAREAAAELGLAIEDVTRDMPVVAGNDIVESITPGPCLRVSLPRGNRGGQVWQLLQRDKAHGAQLPNGYLVMAEDPARLLDALKPVAEQFDTGYYEFEATETDIAAFCEESGDIDEYRMLMDVLISMQGL